MNVPYRILFVCMGNICRSPIAEAVTRTMAQRQGLAAMLQLDSAGTHGHYHAGEAPDVRARLTAYYRPHVAELQSGLDRDFGWAGFQ